MRKTHTDKYTADSVVSLLQLLEKLKLSGVEVVFRGQTRDWPLIPELGRSPFLLQGKAYDRWIDFEDDLLEKFIKYSVPFLTFRPTSEWDWLYIARHHRLPTRLLDWSSNPLKGLFFAVQDFRHDNTDSVLWVLEASGWMETLDNDNRRSLKDMLLVYPSHINERIIAQESCFTAFPLPRKHGEFLPAEKTRLVHRAIKIVIPARARQILRSELSVLGIVHRTMFPSLEGVAASIRAEYGEGWLHKK